MRTHRQSKLPIDLELQTMIVEFVVIEAKMKITDLVVGTTEVRCIVTHDKSRSSSDTDETFKSSQERGSRQVLNTRQMHCLDNSTDEDCTPYIGNDVSATFHLDLPDVIQYRRLERR